MLWREVLTESAQQQAVLHQPLEGLQQEGAEWQVADSLELEVFAHGLQLPGAPPGPLQLSQHLVMLLEVAAEALWEMRCEWRPPPGWTLGMDSGEPHWQRHPVSEWLRNHSQQGWGTL